MPYKKYIFGFALRNYGSSHSQSSESIHTQAISVLWKPYLYKKACLKN